MRRIGLGRDGGEVRPQHDRGELIDETAAGSTYPGVRAWLEETVREPDDDLAVLREFGPRDGR